MAHVGPVASPIGPSAASGSRVPAAAFADPWSHAQGPKPDRVRWRNREAGRSIAARWRRLWAEFVVGARAEAENRAGGALWPLASAIGGGPLEAVDSLDGRLSSGFKAFQFWKAEPAISRPLATVSTRARP